MDSLFDRILGLVRTTGERCVVVDRTSATAFVVLPLDEYERLRRTPDLAVADLTPDGLLDKINRDVAEWREANRETDDADATSDPDTAESRQALSGAGSEERFYFEPIE